MICCVCGVNVKAKLNNHGCHPFDVWWYNEGSGVGSKGRCLEEHAHYMAKIAWENGAYCEKNKNSRGAR
jgi:hypothetical protein